MSLLQHFDPDVFPGDVVRTCARFDAVNLQADEAFRVSLVDIFVGQIFDRFAIDPGLNSRAFGDDAELVPLTIFHGFVRFQTFLRRPPASLYRSVSTDCFGGFAIDVTRFCSVGATGFNFTLRTVDAAELLVLLFAVGFFGL